MQHAQSDVSSKKIMVNDVGEIMKWLGSLSRRDLEPQAAIPEFSEERLFHM
jgi:hypothetical protein